MWADVVYNIIDLGANTQADRINNSGWVIGRADNGLGGHSTALWQLSGTGVLGHELIQGYDARVLRGLGLPQGVRGPPA